MTDWDQLENELADFVYFMVDISKALVKLMVGLTKAAVNGLRLN